MKLKTVNPKKKINKTKSWFFKKISNVDNPLRQANQKKPKSKKQTKNPKRGNILLTSEMQEGT